MDKKIVLKWSACFALLVTAMLLIVNFYVLGCIVDIFDLLRFALGNIIYVVALLIVMDIKRTKPIIISNVAMFLLLNIIAYFFSGYLYNISFSTP